MSRVDASMLGVIEALQILEQVEFVEDLKSGQAWS